jgi:hypothetical protein
MRGVTELAAMRGLTESPSVRGVIELASMRGMIGLGNAHRSPVRAASVMEEREARSRSPYLESFRAPLGYEFGGHAEKPQKPLLVDFCERIFVLH